MKTFLLFLGLCCSSAAASAAVDIAFLEIYKSDGTRLQLEPDGRFAHVAISFRGKWLHAAPQGGVQLSTQAEIERIGTITAIATLRAFSEPSVDFVRMNLGKPYDSSFDWSDDAFYCSELVGKILNLAPMPMYFDPNLWPAEFQKYNGMPGLSPDGIYRLLQ